MKKTRYIAYGSNLNQAQMQRRCPDSKVLSVGQLLNYRLEFRRVLTVVPCPGSSVPVAVWQISDRDEAKLDLYEGYPSCYRKETLLINFPDGSHCKAMAYLMNKGFIAPPSILYWNIVKEGYKNFNFDSGVLNAALRESRHKKP